MVGKGGQGICARKMFIDPRMSGDVRRLGIGQEYLNDIFEALELVSTLQASLLQTQRERADVKEICFGSSVRPQKGTKTDLKDLDRDRAPRLSSCFKCHRAV